MEIRHRVLILFIISSYILLMVGVVQHKNEYIISGFIVMLCIGCVSIIYRDSKNSTNIIPVIPLK